MALRSCRLIRRSLLRVAGSCETSCVVRVMHVSARCASSSPGAGLPTSQRTGHCGSFSRDGVGTPVVAAGWVSAVRDMGDFCFVVLSDAYGAVQVSVPAPASTLRVRVGDVARAAGAVAARPPGMANPSMATGDIEIVVASPSDVECVGPVTEPLPLPARARGVGEAARLAARHLDLRGAEMQRALRLRSRVVAAMRDALFSDGFVEVETPTLFRSTPEGAREFLVPTRARGRFYALVQSPQQYKQLLMVGGIDRYFQIARCYRDEGGRADRQPEFTQVDLEMSFGGAEDVMGVTERVLRGAVAAANAAIEAGRGVYGGDAAELEARTLSGGDGPLPRMTYAEAMRVYGSDKPDRRIGMPILNITAAARALPAFSTVLGTCSAHLPAPRCLVDHVCVS